MKLLPALEYEKIREDAKDWNKIVAHKEGKFYHVYEWSAWLIKTVSCTEEFQQKRGDQKMLAANRYVSKNNEYVMLGFPLESLSKYVPVQDDIREMEDGSGVEITVSLPLEENEGYEQLRDKFEVWKYSCPQRDTKTKSRKEIVNGDGKAAALGRSGLFSILSQVLSYPVERSTPAENIDFISSLKQQLVGLL